MPSETDLARGDVKVEDRFHLGWTDASKIVEGHPLWNDPFMECLAEPEEDPSLTWSLVENWARQMYHGSLAFPRYVGNLIARVNNHAAGRLLAINAAVERGYPDESRSHFLLAVDLLRTMGLTDQEIVSIPKHPSSSKYIVDHLFYTMHTDLANAIGCLGIGIEALTTKEFSYLGNAFVKTASNVKGLPWEEVYKSQGYFTENIMADKQHTTEFEEIAYLAWKSGELPDTMQRFIDKIEEGARYSLNSRQKFFQGVYDLAVR
ncbi:MAG: iron-containing redox enzyme family protein [Candidatus Aenigmarchaeota archaeon]|nr:iron-containing redox enzyme family protein [Candidatus Aenigmarchaeota archaeon]